MAMKTKKEMDEKDAADIEMLHEMFRKKLEAMSPEEREAWLYSMLEDGEITVFEYEEGIEDY